MSEIGHRVRKWTKQQMAAPITPDVPEALPILDPHRFDSNHRKRLGGPGLRAFLNIADEWELSEQDRIHILGLPARSTFHGWVSRARKGGEITLAVDELTRISAVLG